MVLLRYVFIPGGNVRSGYIEQPDLDVFLLGNHKPEFVLPYRIHKDKGSDEQCFPRADYESAGRAWIRSRYPHSGICLQYPGVEHNDCIRNNVLRYHGDSGGVPGIRWDYKGCSDAVQQLAARRDGSAYTDICVAPFIYNG